MQTFDDKVMWNSKFPNNLKRIDCLFLRLRYLKTKVQRFDTIRSQICWILCKKYFMSPKHAKIAILQGDSNMTGTDLYVNKPHCAAAVRP